MEKRLTSSNKRIVEFCGLMESEDLLKFIGRNQSVLETSSWGGKGIDQEKTRQLLNEYLEPYQFEITKDYTTPNNIGNNHLYYIQDKDVLDDIETLIGRIAINNLMGYAVAIYQEDMDGKRIGKSYLEITARGVKEAPNEKWIGWNQYIQDNHLNWNLNDLEKNEKFVLSFVNVSRKKFYKLKMDISWLYEKVQMEVLCGILQLMNRLLKI